MRCTHEWLCVTCRAAPANRIITERAARNLLPGLDDWLEELRVFSVGTIPNSKSPTWAPQRVYRLTVLQRLAKELLNIDVVNLPKSLT